MSSATPSLLRVVGIRFMSNLSVWVPLAVVCAVFSLVDQTNAEVLIESQPSPWEIKTDTYQAQVDWDGCLSKLRVYGQEFLASNVSISRGSYFYHQGPLQHHEVKHIDANAIIATGDKTSVQYLFDNEGMIWRLENHADAELVFFMVFASNIEGFRSGAEEIQPRPINADTNHFSCFLGGVRLEIEGFTKTWGPWQGSHQVGQVDLKPGEVKKLRIRFAKMTSEQQQVITKLHAPPPEADLTILSPRSYQVFQRRTKQRGEILVSGRCQLDVERVEMKINGQSEFGDLPEGWNPVPLVSIDHEFNTQVELPAGGWYSLDIRAPVERQGGGGGANRELWRWRSFCRGRPIKLYKLWGIQNEANYRYGCFVWRRELENSRRSAARSSRPYPGWQFLACLWRRDVQEVSSTYWCSDNRLRRHQC